MPTTPRASYAELIGQTAATIAASDTGDLITENFLDDRLGAYTKFIVDEIEALKSDPNSRGLVGLSQNQTRTGQLIQGGQLSFTGTDHAGLVLNSLTTAQRDLLTPSNFMLLGNATTGVPQYYSASASSWVDINGGLSLIANTDEFEAKVAQLGATRGTIEVVGDQNLTGNLTVPDNVSVIAHNGANFITNGFNLRFDGHFLAGKYQVFDNASTTVSFHGKATDGIWVEWFGAKSRVGAETFDSTTGFVNAMQTLRNGIDTFTSDMRTCFLAGSYTINQEIHMPQDSSLIGRGGNLSSITAGASFSFPDVDTAMIRSDNAEYTNPGATRRIFLKNLFLCGAQRPNSNGILASQQQPAYWQNIRVDDCEGYGIAIVDTQQLWISNLEMIRNRVGLILRSCEFCWVYGFNSDQHSEINVKYEIQPMGGVGNNSNHFYAAHLEEGSPQTGPMIDIQSCASNTFDGFFVTSNTTTVFNSGPSGSGANTFTLREISFSGTPATVTAVNDQDRNIVLNAFDDCRSHISELIFSNVQNGYSGAAWGVEGIDKYIRAHVADGTILTIQQDATNRGLLAGQTDGDTVPRFLMYGDGKVEMSGGSAASDITWERTAAGQLTINPGYLIANQVPRSRLSQTSTSTTIDVSGGVRVVELAPSAAVVYTDLTNSDQNQFVTIISQNGNITINNGAPFLMNGNWTPGSNETITFVRFAAFWVEVGRSH